MVSTWERRPDIGRKMPDMTDVGPGHVWQKGQNNSVRINSETLTKKEIELKSSANKYLSYPSPSMMSQHENANPDVEFKDSLKETNPEDLIYLRGPCTEASIINVLRSRFKKELIPGISEEL